MKKHTLTPVLFLLTIVCSFHVKAQSSIDSVLPVRGFCIAAPQKKNIDAFATFITKELAPRGVNTLILRIDYNYEYVSHPELRDSNALSKSDIKKLVAACRQGKIRIIPQVNLLGHQSWATQVSNLLRVYPQFDETPQVKMPEKYEWPNTDGLYCKSYCPLHPEVHKIVFALMDEICEVFETDAFHAGMDEVFYLGDDKCPRCSGRDKAVLYADEVRKIRDHLAQKNRELWIWGDRLIDGKTTGIGMWEGSFNNTHRAIDMIPKDVFICDWHYERPDKTAVHFAMKGLRVATCPWRTPAHAITQLNDMVGFRKGSTPEMKQYFQGMIQTVWSGAEHFMNEFYGRTKNENAGQNTQSNCFRLLFEHLNAITK